MPRARKPLVRDAVLVEDIALVWFEAHRRQWTDAILSLNLLCWERHIEPAIGRREVQSLTPELIQREVYDPLEPERVRLAKAVHAALIGMIDHARRMGMVSLAANPADLKDRKPMRAPLSRVLLPENDLAFARQLLVAIERTPTRSAAKLVLPFAAVTVVPAERVLAARWDQFSDSGAEGPIWRASPTRRSPGAEMMVPLSTQALEILERARSACGDTPLVFPKRRSYPTPLVEAAVRKFLTNARLRGERTLHGWRRIFSAVMCERQPTQLGLVTACLDGSEPVGDERIAELAARRVMLQEWADLLLDGIGAPLH